MLCSWENEYRNIVCKLQKKMSFSDGTFIPAFGNSIILFVLPVNTVLKFSIIQKEVSLVRRSRVGLPELQKKDVIVSRFSLLLHKSSLQFTCYKHILH